MISGLLIIGFPYAALIGTFAGLTNLIPYLGPLIGMVPPLIVAVVNGTSTVEILSLAAVFTVAQIIDNVLIVPMLVARIVDLHAVIVLVAIIFGAQVGGILGMIISIPVASILKLIIVAIYQMLMDQNLPD